MCIRDRPDAVAILQPYSRRKVRLAVAGANGQPCRLVLAADGTWRWFFGRSPEFIQQITQESGQNTAPAPLPDRTRIPAPELFAAAIPANTAHAPPSLGPPRESPAPPAWRK